MEILTFHPGSRRGRKLGPLLIISGLRSVRLWFFLLGFWSAGQNWIVAQGQIVSHEYPLKAVFLLNFARFTDWPTNAFDQPKSPLVIGVLGDDPFGELLDVATRDESIDGRKFIVERYRRLAEIKTCHILFVSQSEMPRLARIIAALSGRPILTVSDIGDSAQRGLCAGFVTENNKIRLQINVASLKNANLSMSSQLLRLAQIFSNQTNDPPR